MAKQQPSVPLLDTTAATWQTSCGHCLATLHAGSLLRHYQKKHAEEDVPAALRKRHFEYRKVQRLKDKEKPQSSKKEVSSPQPHHRRKSIRLKGLDGKRTAPFVLFLQSAFGGSNAPSYARELGVIYGKIVCFEGLAAAVGEITDEAIDAIFSDLGRFTRLFSLLESEIECKASTLEKWMQAALKAARWRVHLLAQVKDQTPIITNKLHKLGLVDKYFNDYNRSLLKKKGQQQRQHAVSVDDRMEQGTWCTRQEWKNAVEMALSDFLQMVNTVKETTGFDSANYQEALDYCMALFYAESRPTRPGFLRALTLQDWDHIQTTGTFATRDFKTAGHYGEQVYSFGKHTLTAWALFVDHLRVQVVGDQTFLFVHSQGGRLNVSRCLAGFSVKYLQKHITPTTLRGVLATEAEDTLGQEDAATLHRADTHSSATVNLYYDHKAATRVATAADQIFGAMSPPLELAPLVAAAGSSSSSAVYPIELSSDDDDDDDRTLSDEPGEEVEAPPPPPPLPQLLPDPGKPVPRLNKRKFNAPEQPQRTDKHRQKRHRFSKREVLFVSAYGQQEQPNWHQALQQGKQRGIIHAKRTHKNLVDCWRCVQKGSYVKSFGINTEGKEDL